MKYLFLFLYFLSPVLIYAENNDDIKNTLVKVNSLKEKNEYENIITLMNTEIKSGKLYSIYFDILGGAYTKLNKNEEAYLAYLRGYLYNPLTEYGRTKLLPKMRFFENRIAEQDPKSWLHKYLTIKIKFDNGDYIAADNLVETLLAEDQHIDVTCVLSKDIKSFIVSPQDTSLLITNLTRAESNFNAVIHKMGDQCPEFVYYEYADLFYKTGKYDKAIEYYRISLEKNPLRRDNALKLGASLLYNKNYSEAHEILLKCTEKNPEYAEAALYLGFTYWAGKETDKALKMFKTTADLCKTTNPMLREKARKAIEVVNKGDLFLTPNDVAKIMETTKPMHTQHKPQPKNTEKEEVKTDEPTQSK